MPVIGACVPCATNKRTQRALMDLPPSLTTGTDALSFTTALHTYYRVQDISKVRGRRSVQQRAMHCTLLPGITTRLCVLRVCQRCVLWMRFGGALPRRCV